MRDKSLLRWVVGKCYALLDVAFEAGHASLEESLLSVINACKDVDCFLGTVWLHVVSYD